MTDNTFDTPVEALGDQLLIPALTIGAFPVLSESRRVIELTAKDRRVSRSKWSIQDGGVEEAIKTYRQKPSPNLLLIENNDPPEQLMQALDRLASECQPDTKVIIISAQNDVNLFRQLLERGVTDELTTPFRPMDVLNAIARAWEGEAESKIGRLVCFIGTRGGVGASTVSHNVGAVIAKRFELDVLLADLDLQFGTLGIDFDVEGSYGMNDVLQSAERLDDVLLDRIALKYDEHLQLLATEPNLERLPDLHDDAIERLIDLAHTTPRHVILDIPRILTGRSRRALIHADQIVITATPDLTSLRNTKLVVEFLRQTRPNDPMPILILNQVGQPKRPEITTLDFLEAVRLSDCHTIPFNPSLFGKAANNGQPVAYYAEKSSMNRIFTKIAEEIIFPNARKNDEAIQRKVARFIRRWW